ncbi:MAG: flagellar basal body P-ring formation chaperone FlgA [Cycloclasticus sp.]
MTLINWYEVYVLKQSPVLNEPVEEGEAYNPSKVVFKKQFVKLGTWPSKRKLVSSEFLKDFKPGDAISSYMLRDRLIVVAGDVVTVSYLNKHISIEAEAIALSSGSLGSEINIVRSSGEEAFRAIVVGPKKLEVKI